MKIQLPTNEDKFHEQILGFFNFGIGLTPQELKVLAKIISLNLEYKELPEEKRIKYIFSSEVRKEVCQELKISAQNFNNILTRLKKKTFFSTPVLDEDYKVPKALLIETPKDKFSIVIDFLPDHELLSTKSNPDTPDKTEVEIAPKIEEEEKEQKVQPKEYVLESLPHIGVVTYNEKFEAWQDANGNFFPKHLKVIPYHNERLPEESS